METMNSVKDQIETHLLQWRYAEASKRQIRDLHAAKTVVIHMWARKQLDRLKGELL